MKPSIVKSETNYSTQGQEVIVSRNGTVQYAAAKVGVPESTIEWDSSSLII